MFRNIVDIIACKDFIFCYYLLKKYVHRFVPTTRGSKAQTRVNPMLSIPQLFTMIVDPRVRVSREDDRRVKDKR